MTGDPNKTEHQSANDRTVADFTAMMRSFRPPLPLRVMGEESWVQFWRGQDVVLTCMEEFSEGWFRRRHVATETALDTALRCCEAASPFDIAREMLNWSMGSMQRVMEDGRACQKCCLELARLTPHVSPEEEAEGRQDNSAPRARPAVKAGDAAEKAKVA